ncbi:hypothetical protein [Thermomonas carbonis]|nr:hypothetical protein [Thermomonas carbonis]GHC05860.1 hypothetical protein GCM10010080_19730 [Thermomonas carbonis]
MLVLLALLASFSLIGSDLPRAWAWPLAAGVLLFGVRDARSYLREQALQLLVPAGLGVVQCDGVAVQDLRVAWRGPLAFLRWRGADRRIRRIVLWPDLLDAGARRELKLAMQRREAAAGSPSMAG